MCERSHCLPRVNKQVVCAHGDVADGDSLLTFEERSFALLISSEGEDTMKYKILFCSVLLMMAFANLTVARDLPSNGAGIKTERPSGRNQRGRISLGKLGYKNLRDASQYSTFLGDDWTSLSYAESRPILLTNLPYKNILSVSKWSRMLTGRSRTTRLKKNAHVPPGDEEMFMVEEYSGGGCNWTCCFKQCMNSAMHGTGNLCLNSCTGCGLTGGAWPCAICVGCGTVGFASIEFCGLHCCVDPGC